MRWFGLSLVIHLGLVLAFGLWLCPWFERIAPDRRSSAIDIDFEMNTVPVLSEKRHAMPASKRRQNNAQPSQPSSMLDAHGLTHAPLKNAADTPFHSPNVPSISAPPDQQLDLQADFGEGSPRTVSLQDYIKWVRSHNERPIYPRLARLRDEHGVVVLRVTIAKRGTPVESVQVEKSSGSELLDRVTMQTVSSWHYPPFQAPQPQIVVLIPFRFVIND